MRKRKWTKEQLQKAAIESTSVRKIIQKLGLKPAGGNYDQINKYLKLYKININHLKGRAWNKGLTGIGKPIIPLEKILRKNSHYQSYKLKNRLFKINLKKPRCELCGWNKKSPDGRVPLELDHINGDKLDNRINNIRILCPNCHSLQPTHRGLNRNKK
ncbi:MAG: hypothetical protein COU22_03275 [Candidatus Komeilibacteria bacterium CG10_big_fil_rev_8_21_14_0_10_41_13]|uniref:HNH nuclease domain-containing protein n=1 Tax=Candidatus Komeilibacteria bacterium CG10_big_fil_rev_8_21_14_0_10_41_13 TaxID=1974476 RepID=A0A2M6WBQ3_9BACT|nr:MAG: hypothetical protein COU22_03275 [Candidatus Komeilibacteria bacterium CG10_big_fil_rev_8_21_14_0_10_41_13]